MWDLAYAAHGFVGMAPGNDPSSDAGRLAALADGYGIADDDRLRLVRLLPRRIRAMFDLLVAGHRTGAQPWSRLYADRHADHWGPTAEYAKASSDAFRDALVHRQRSPGQKPPCLRSGRGRPSGSCITR